ncbi:MAG: hypothetical protein U0T83_01320 [Bacteriovoracaceae bacterium]
MDQEILQMFSDEIRAIEKELKVVIFGLIKSKLRDKSLFEKYGQIIDRVYGTAATLNFMEVADYCRMMKEITYKCSASDNEVGIQKCMYLMLESLKYLEIIPKTVSDAEELKKIRYKMKLDLGRGENLTRSYFFSIKKTSVDRG